LNEKVYSNIVIGIFGYKGSGKTLMLVLLAYAEFVLGKHLLMNMKDMNFPTEVLDPDDLVKLSDKLIGCTICIDEIHTVADSRKSHSKQNIQIANFILQSRHRGVNVIYTDQYEGQAEKRIRENTDVVIVARNLYIDSDNDGYDDMFEYVIMDLRKETQKVIQIYGKPIFGLYSTAEIIDIYEYKKEKTNGRKN
jgi:hypothetical protein